MTAKKPKRIPSFRHHKDSGQGFLELDGQRHYLGRFDLPETQERYHRLIAEWLANDRQLSVDPSDITIVELCARFWRHAKAYYRRPDGTPTSEIENVRLALRSVKALYGSTAAAQFGPRALKTVRQQMIDQGACRTYINRHLGRVKLMFKWAVSEGLIEPSVYHGLQAVAGLKRGRSEARESEPVIPVRAAAAIVLWVAGVWWFGLDHGYTLGDASDGPVLMFGRVRDVGAQMPVFDDGTAARPLRCYLASADPQPGTWTLLVARWNASDAVLEWR